MPPFRGTLTQYLAFEYGLHGSVLGEILRLVSTRWAFTTRCAFCAGNSAIRLFIWPRVRLKREVLLTPLLIHFPWLRRKAFPFRSRCRHLMLHRDVCGCRCLDNHGGQRWGRHRLKPSHDWTHFGQLLPTRPKYSSRTCDQELCDNSPIAISPAFPGPGCRPAKKEYNYLITLLRNMSIDHQSSNVERR